MKKYFVGLIGVGVFDPYEGTDASYWFSDPILAEQAVKHLNKTKSFYEWRTTWPKQYLPGVNQVVVFDTEEEYKANTEGYFLTQMEEGFQPNGMKELIIPEYHKVMMSAENGAMCGGNFSSKEVANHVASQTTGYWNDQAFTETVKEQKFNVISSWEEFLSLIKPRQTDFQK